MNLASTLQSHVAQSAMTPWQRSLIGLGVAWGLLLVIFRQDAADMVGIWSVSYKHIRAHETN
jgi:hypothetical protein